MPHVIVKLWPGKSEQQKTRLAEAITKDVMNTLHYVFGDCFGEPRFLLFGFSRPEFYDDMRHDFLLSVLAVLLVADFFHPVHNLPVECLLNGDVRHGGSGRSTMPVLQSWREPDHITGPDLLDRAVLALHPANTGCDNQRLTERMLVPRGARTRLERDARTGGACWSVCLKQRINTHRAGEPIARTFGGRLCANSFDFHI